MECFIEDLFAYISMTESGEYIFVVYITFKHTYHFSCKLHPFVPQKKNRSLYLETLFQGTRSYFYWFMYSRWTMPQSETENKSHPIDCEAFAKKMKMPVLHQAKKRPFEKHARCINCHWLHCPGIWKVLNSLGINIFLIM